MSKPFGGGDFVGVSCWRCYSLLLVMVFLSWCTSLSDYSFVWSFVFLSFHFLFAMNRCAICLWTLACLLICAPVRIILYCVRRWRQMLCLPSTCERLTEGFLPARSSTSHYQSEERKNYSHPANASQEMLYCCWIHVTLCGIFKFPCRGQVCDFTFSFLPVYSPAFQHQSERRKKWIEHITCLTDIFV